MDLDEPAAYGEAFADVYDEWYTDISDVAATVLGVKRLAGGGTVLELGIGTGRLALPLAAAGVRMHGVDASPSMLRVLEGKPGSEMISVIRADMAELPVSGPYELVFAAFNTFFNLPTADAQRRCLDRVADVLSPTGRLAVEVFVPSAEPDQIEEAEATRSDGSGGSITTRTTRDPETQQVQGVHVHTTLEGQVRSIEWLIRYLHPHQLDTLCHEAGLALEHRWCDWHGNDFTDDASRSVSVYRLGNPTTATRPQELRQ